MKFLSLKYCAPLKKKKKFNEEILDYFQLDLDYSSHVVIES